MAGKIKFPLIMADGAVVHDLEELKKHFDLASVLCHYYDGKLAVWLENSYYEDEARRVRALDPSDPDHRRKLCEILGIQFADVVDLVAFTQEELDELLARIESTTSAPKTIYLCKGRFTIPADRGHTVYIGIGDPEIELPGDTLAEGIDFQNIRFDMDSFLGSHNDYEKFFRVFNKNCTLGIRLLSVSEENGSVIARAILDECHKRGFGVEKAQEDFPQKVPDSVKALIDLAKDDFLALVPQARALGYPEYGKVHGLGHIYRVLLLSLIYYYNAGDSLSPEDKNILIYFSLLHDIGRTNDWKDDSHGEKSVERIKEKPIEIKGLNLTEEDKAIASLVIRCHSISDTKGEVRIQSEMTKEHSRDRALKLYRICKDMDGLDRMRLGKRGLDTSQLRTDYAKSMVDTARIIYNDHLARRLSERIPKLRVERANIVKVTADAIVLPANETLTCTSEKGAYGAIFKAVGKEKLEQACKEFLRKQGKESCAIGSVAVTPAFDLDADWIIHAVVPRWEGGEYEEFSKLCSAYMSALTLADHLKCSSIAFPLLASGQKRFSKKLAIRAAAECVHKFQGENLKKIILVVYDDDSVLSAKQLGYTVHETYSSPRKEGKEVNHPRKHNHSGVWEQIVEVATLAATWMDDPKNQEKIKTYAGLAMKALVRRGLLKY